MAIKAKYVRGDWIIKDKRVAVRHVAAVASVTVRPPSKGRCRSGHGDAATCGGGTAMPSDEGKRQPGRNALQEDEALKMLHDPATYRNAIRVCSMDHALRLAHNKATSAVYRPSSTVYGQRHTLEMFGLGEHGRLAVRTKEPVGNGTKIYTR